jgi:hypothetical protein
VHAHVEKAIVKSSVSRIIVLFTCLSVTSVTYALELGYLSPAADAATRQIPESAMLVILGVTLLIVARHARLRPRFVSRLDA